MRRIVATLTIAVLVLAAAPVEARGPGDKKGLWIAVGAGAGFGIGLLVGLTAFDDAINSERKIWTTAIVSAAAGGTLGYLLSRGSRSGGTSPSRTATTLSDREVDILARTVPLRGGPASVVQFADANAPARRF